MLNTIAKPFGVLLLWIYSLVDNYGLAIILFACVVKLILLPFQMKSKKSMMRMTRLQPKLKELEKRHEGNQRQYQEEVSKLYREEKVNPMSGCIWSLIPFPILIALYQAIRFPLTVMMRIDSALLEEGGALYTKLTEAGFDAYVETANLSSRTLSGYKELVQSQFISNNFDLFSGISDKLVQINYKFLGINLGDMPRLKFWTAENFTWSDISVWLPCILLVLIPVISAFLSWLSMKVSQSMTPDSGGQTAQQMKSMNLMMPLISLYICFVMPAALGIYWIANSVLAIIQELILNSHYRKVLEAEDAERRERELAREAELERKRQETDRQRAAGTTTVNTSTSKKKIQARQKAELDEMKAAAIREEKADRRAKLGIEEEEIPESQVGNRRYARGRAYIANRFEQQAENAATVVEQSAEDSAAAEQQESSEQAAKPEEVQAADVAEVPIEADKSEEVQSDVAEVSTDVAQSEAELSEKREE